MEFQELNETVKEQVGLDWFHWRGSWYEEGAGFVSDKTIMVKEEFTEPFVFEFLERMEGSSDTDRLPLEQAQQDWDAFISRFGVYRLEPLAFLDIHDDNEFLYNYLILFKNESISRNIIVDADRYRLLLEAVPVDRLLGKEPSDPLVSLQINDSNDETFEDPTGIICPITDQSGKYIEKFRSEFPDLRI